MRNVNFTNISYFYPHLFSKNIIHKAAVPTIVTNNNNIITWNILPNYACCHVVPYKNIYELSYQEQINLSLRFALKEPVKNDLKIDKKHNEKIKETYQCLYESLPNFFNQQHPFNIYHDNIIFENNIQGFTLKGKTQYFAWLYYKRIVSHIKYGSIKFNILKMTLHEETNTIKIRWQLQAVSNTRTFFRLWGKNNYDVFKDGFSTLYLNSNGLITKHIMEKMMPDEDYKLEPNAAVKPSGIVSTIKAAIIIGLLYPSDNLPSLADK